MPRRQQTQKASTAKATRTQTGGKTAQAKKEAPAKVAPVKATPAKATPAKEAPAKVEAQTGGVVKKDRYFKVIYGGGEAHGRFSGSKPKQAANKALTSILKELKNEKKNTKGKIDFQIRECTRGSKCKEYSYVGERRKLDQPLEVQLKKVLDDSGKPKTIKYAYENVVRKAPKATV
ncbi:MAG: hypothetical protein CMF62_01490 [Magnetococcales bacterium]|nr:hypothetical protein [Magnetococcales bacterium]|tara:strand:- start:26589 stop:27116 length:528 start_codon:yes stop_codon:yes gene_type:complete